MGVSSEVEIRKDLGKGKRGKTDEKFRDTIPIQSRTLTIKK